MKGKLLPIGTVVTIEGGTKKVMITGYYSKNEGESKIYTYNGCIFPEGFMDNTFLLFDQPEIEDVLYRGLENEESEEYAHLIQNHLDLTNSPVRKEEVASGGVGKAGRRAPKAPTRPMSSSEMRAKYTREKISGGQTEKFDFSKLNK